MAKYKVKLLSQRDYSATKWSGGTTTELFIEPESSIYAERDFTWRLSTATVEIEESEFTSLPDYNRIIMTLEGGIRLSHNKGEWIELPVFTPHSFDGGDETVSVGKVTDFNLMLRKGVCTGALVPLVLSMSDDVIFNDDLQEDIRNCKAVMIYCYSGTLFVSMETKEMFKLDAGEAIRVDGKLTKADWYCKAISDVRAVVALVR